jgi:predicted RND superfamily exporter protein
VIERSGHGLRIAEESSSGQTPWTGARWPFVALYALLLVPSVHFAIRVGQGDSLDRLIVPGDPDHIATQEFEQVFGLGEFALLLAEADDPYAPAVLARVDGIERTLAAADLEKVIGEITRHEMASRLQLFEGEDVSASYMGWAVKR